MARFLGIYYEFTFLNGPKIFPPNIGFKVHAISETLTQMAEKSSFSFHPIPFLLQINLVNVQSFRPSCIFSTYLDTR
jgi:hypothetical protein